MTDAKKKQSNFVKTAGHFRLDKELPPLNTTYNFLSDSPHSEQFRELTRRLLLLIFSSAGVTPRMPAEDIDHYAKLALFHAIGKQAIPSATLNKPAR